MGSRSNNLDPTRWDVCPKFGEPPYSRSRARRKELGFTWHLRPPPDLQPTPRLQELSLLRIPIRMREMGVPKGILIRHVTEAWAKAEAH
jgi:hypothetical protein